MSKTEIEKYSEHIRNQKQEIMKLDKEKLVDTIFRQNTIIVQQSSQLMDLVKLVNTIDASHSSDISEKRVVDDKIQKNIEILKNRNKLCKVANEMRAEQAMIFKTSAMFQIILFVLFVLVCIWLVHQLTNFKN